MASMASGFGCPLKAPPLASRACLASPSDRPSSFFLSLSHGLFFLSVVAPLPSFRLAFGAGTVAVAVAGTRQRLLEDDEKPKEKELAQMHGSLHHRHASLFLSVRLSFCLSFLTAVLWYALVSAHCCCCCWSFACTEAANLQQRSYIICYLSAEFSRQLAD